jgi:hypothetical protein
MTHKTGSIGDFMRWTKQVVTDPVAAKDTPKRWFDNEETAARSSGAPASPEAMVKLLSAENLVLLHIIGTERPPLYARSQPLRIVRSQIYLEP